MSKPITDEQLDQLFEAGCAEFKSKGNFTTDARFMRLAAMRKVFYAGRDSARPEGDAKDGESDRLADAVGLRIVGLEKTFSEANRPEWAKLCRAALFDLDKLKNYAHTMERGVCVLTSRSPQQFFNKEKS